MQNFFKESVVIACIMESTNVTLKAQLVLVPGDLD